jgi:hypothetical protein
LRLDLSRWPTWTSTTWGCPCSGGLDRDVDIDFQAAFVKFEFQVTVQTIRHFLLDQLGAESSVFRPLDRRAAGFPPIHQQVPVAHVPTDLHMAFFASQRSIFYSIGDEFVQDHAKG